ncbi:MULTISPECIES: transporter substrate-binding domain-containing protein [Eubacterium]|uniref:Polar amino acid transport system substrate-binding protein n=1 Tax=Eubacterium barkeri TaxID=1528 RepID=A0A1H3CEA5_EUBBA|nr:transporter substrate-binding domain-containing protein [Eubacterium barkeri]SDX52228.1 polar amino acid transport system substrate-binding protein [Eubacterium barkeri]
MKRFAKIGIVVLVLAMVCSLAACSSGSTNSGSDGGDKTYVIATDTTFAPFEFENEKGEMVGIDMDLLKAISEDQGFKYELKVLGFNAAVQALESQQVDGVIAGMSITDERKQKFDFSNPYFESGVGMAVAADNNDIKSYEDLKGKKVAVKTGTEGYQFADSIKDKYGFTLTTFEDSANMYEDVKSGNAAACFEDYPVLGYAITKGQPLKMIGELQNGSPYGLAVSKGKNAELIEKFNAGLKNIKENGKYQEIIDTYITK